MYHSIALLALLLTIMWLVCDQFKGIIFLNLFVLKLKPQLDYVVIVKQQPRRIEAIFAATLKLAQMGKGTQSREGRKSAPAENLRMRACSSARPGTSLRCTLCCCTRPLTVVAPWRTGCAGSSLRIPRHLASLSAGSGRSHRD
ncbi:hypothetical protein F5Y08DRAFT_64849 [Xylaria arbuscula]|nr:hypothetical protein F5Y08DRAFT_64849 [Xylaria arbuscula]